MGEQKKQYCGNGKVINTKAGFSFLAFNLSPEDIALINGRSAENNGWCKINIMQRKEPSAKGTTHYGVIDTWQPEQRIELPIDIDGTPENESVPF